MTIPAIGKTRRPAQLRDAFQIGEAITPAKKKRFLKLIVPDWPELLRDCCGSGADRSCWSATSVSVWRRARLSFYPKELKAVLHHCDVPGKCESWTPPQGFPARAMWLFLISDPPFQEEAARLNMRPDRQYNGIPDDIEKLGILIIFPN
jgi:hypothetical protein